MEKLFEQNNVTVYKLAEKKIAIIEMKGKFADDVYRKTLLKCLDILVENDCSKIVLNALELESTSPTARAWVATSYTKMVSERLPKACLATVKSKTLFQTMAFTIIKSTILSNYKDLKVEMFETIDEAKAWLESL